MAALLKPKRLEAIIDEARAHRQVTVAALSDRFGVSEITIRRDLHELVNTGQLRRTYGGAVMPISAAPELPMLQRTDQMRTYKKAIGYTAAQLVHDGESIFVGTGTTTSCILPHITDRKDLTVITNALNVALSLATSPGITVVVTGGLLRSTELSLVGHLTARSLCELRVDKVLVGMRTISLEAGLTNDSLMEVETDRTIIDMSPELIVLADHTKFGKVASAFIAPIESIATLVTDWETDPRTIEALHRLGIRTVVAEEWPVGA